MLGNNRTLKCAVFKVPDIKRIEIIGEAVKNLPKEFTEKYKNIQWKEISATRDKIIHHYFGIDLNIVWNITKNDIPKLKEEILKINFPKLLF